jgi:quercetin dioxygenase-like cupin family protein
MAAKRNFEEPEGDQPLGHHRYRRPPTAYEQFMKEEEIPIFKGIGVYDLRQLELGPWKRMGGRGSFLYLDGLGAIKGMYVVEVPAAGALNPEHHFYDEFLFVVEGRGSTEVWRENEPQKQVFEWQAGSLFTIPLNTTHRLVNASSSPALVLAATNAPPIMNIFQSRRFIFENPYEFRERYDATDEYFKANEEVEADPYKGRAILRSNIFHDIVNCELPLDNQRAPGYRRFQPFYHGFQHDAGSAGGFIAQYPPGRYSKAHYHQARAVLVCLQGKGYTLNWPKDIGTKPWEAGKGHLVRRQDYIPGGLVAAAPGGGSWFHQHFGISKEPFRILNFWGGPTPQSGSELGDPDREIVSANIYGMEDGGDSINYRNEDPYILSEYTACLDREGAELQMPKSLYQK